MFSTGFKFVVFLLLTLGIIFCVRIALSLYEAMEIKVELILHERYHADSSPQKHSILQNNSYTEPNAVTDVYFIKVHKTGSSTVQNIFFRYAMNNHLRVATFNTPWGMTYPFKAKGKLLFEKYENTSKPFNFLCDHSIFDRKAVGIYLKKGYTTIGILREPLSQLRSTFAFWDLHKTFRIEEKSNAVEEFLHSGPAKYRKISGKLFSRVQNPQAFHYGYHKVSDNRRHSIINFVQMLESNIDCMLMTDLFEESLIIMKRRLKWQLKDVLYRSLYVTNNKNINKTAKENPRNDSDMKSTLYTFSAVDYNIYQYFLSKVRDTVNRNVNDIQGEIAHFKSVNGKVVQFCQMLCHNLNQWCLENYINNKTQHCISEYLVSNLLNVQASKWNSRFSWSYLDCVKMQIPTVEYQNAFRKIQMSEEEVCQADSAVYRKPLFYLHDFNRRTEWCHAKMLFGFPDIVIYTAINQMCPRVKYNSL